MTQEALKLALDALENHTAIKHPQQIHYRDKAITAIKKALAQDQEPVAWMFQHDETGRMNYVSNDEVHNPTIFLEMNPRYALVCPLYAHPPQRTWVGLTSEKIDSYFEDHGWSPSEDYYPVIKDIEAKLKEFNT